MNTAKPKHSRRTETQPRQDSRSSRTNIHTQTHTHRASTDRGLCRPGRRRWSGWGPGTSAPPRAAPSCPGVAPLASPSGDGPAPSAPPIHPEHPFAESTPGISVLTLLLSGDGPAPSAPPIHPEHPFAESTPGISVLTLLLSGDGPAPSALPTHPGHPFAESTPGISVLTLLLSGDGPAASAPPAHPGHPFAESTPGISVLTLLLSGDGPAVSVLATHPGHPTMETGFKATSGNAPSAGPTLSIDTALRMMRKGGAWGHRPRYSAIVMVVGASSLVCRHSSCTKSVSLGYMMNIACPFCSFLTWQSSCTMTNNATGFLYNDKATGLRYEHCLPFQLLAEGQTVLLGYVMYIAFPSNFLLTWQNSYTTMNNVTGLHHEQHHLPFPVLSTPCWHDITSTQQWHWVTWWNM